MKLAAFTILTSLLSSGFALAADQPLSDSECQKVWVMAVQSNDSLSPYGAAPYIVVFKDVDTDGNGQISNSEFKKGCENGLVHSAAADKQ
jgi:hypothetical protein